MKQHLLRIGLSVLLIVALSACSLEEYNPSNATPENEWTTLAGYKKKINDCYYNYIRVVYGQGEDTFVALSETGTDIWGSVGAYDGSNSWNQVSTYRSYGANTGMMAEAYSGFYGTVFACNGAIAYASKVTDATEDEIKPLVAEAYFLRAHALFNIVEYFGGKYLTTEEFAEGLKTLPMSSVNDFYDVIISDLEYAMKNLPISHDITGPAIRAAAYHLYAKACLTYATYTDGLSASKALTADQSKELLNKAKTAADYLLDHQVELGVELYDETSEVFADANNKSNKEALFVVTHSSIQALNPRGNYFNRAWKHMCTWNNNSLGLYMNCLKPSYETSVEGITVEPRAKGNAYYAPTKYFIDMFKDNDSRFNSYFRTSWTANTANNGTYYLWTDSDAERYGLDKGRVGNEAYKIALGDTCIVLLKNAKTLAERNSLRYATYNLGDNYKWTTDSIGRFAPSLRKGDLTSMYGGSNPSKPFTYADCIIYRLAETYLLAAEIDWRLGDNAAAARRINVIRNRAEVDHDHSMDVTASEVNKQLLLDENALELCGEWNRWTTLKRFRAFETQLQHNKQVAGFNKDTHYLRAIPLKEINLIENQAEYQNPGY